MEQDKADRIFINFPRHCVFGHVLSDTNPLDDVDSWKEVVCHCTTIQETKECRSTQIESNTNSTENSEQQEITTKE